MLSWAQRGATKKKKREERSGDAWSEENLDWLKLNVKRGIDFRRNRHSTLWEKRSTTGRKKGKPGELFPLPQKTNANLFGGIEVKNSFPPEKKEKSRKRVGTTQ